MCLYEFAVIVFDLAFAL